MKPKKGAFSNKLKKENKRPSCAGLVPKHDGRPSVPPPGEADWPADCDEVLALHRHVPGWRFFRHIFRGHRWSPGRSQPWKSKDPSLPDAGPPRHSAVRGMMLLLCRGHHRVAGWRGDGDRPRHDVNSSSGSSSRELSVCVFMLTAKCTSTTTLLVPGKPRMLQCPLFPRLLFYISSWRHTKIRSGMAMTNGPSTMPQYHAPPFPPLPGPLPYVIAMDYADRQTDIDR